MIRALVTSSRYSPGNMTPESLEALFVAREELLADTLRRLAESATGQTKRFILLVGPRGAGKTHFVALLHHRLANSKAYTDVRAKAKIATLNEEEWGIASYLDLLMRILQVCANASDDDVLKSNIDSLQDEHARNPSDTVRKAEQLLIDHLQDSSLVLICENFHDLLKGIGSDGQKQWRAFIQQHPFWTILATTPRISEDIKSHKAPFYGLFSIRHLEPLTFGDAVSLLSKKARLDGQDDLAVFLRTPTGRARARAIHHLAGGNPRVNVILSEFLTRQSLDDLVEPFMRLADDLAPYYQDRLRQLAPRQRKIIEYLCRHIRPATVKTVAENCLLTHQTTSKQIHELAQQGLVSRIKAGRNTYCELTEPLMRISLQVKDNRTHYLRLFVEFLRNWFSASELNNSVQAVILLGRELKERGPVAMANQVSDLRGSLPVDREGEILAQLTTEVLYDQVSSEKFGNSDWQASLPVIESSLNDVPQCQLAVEMYSVAIRYAATKDEEVLLELPLELRELLLQRLP